MWKKKESAKHVEKILRPKIIIINSNLDHKKCRESIRVANHVVDAAIIIMLNCLTCCNSAFAERFGIKVNFSDDL